jgi:hypothetical protein
MNILLVSFSVSQLICIFMAIILWATTHVQTLSRSAGSLVFLGLTIFLTPTRVALFDCYNEHRIAS